MNWKTILVHLDDEPRCAERVALAAQLAVQHGAHLVGASPTGWPDVPIAVNGVLPDMATAVALSAAELRAIAEERATVFERQARAAEVASFASRVVEGEPLDVTARLGRSADLVVVGQTDLDADIPGIARDFPQQVALATGGPVLVVPYAGRFAGIGRDVLVAWKDVREAARAVRDALPLLAKARRVILLELVPPETSADTAALAELQEHLARHGIAADARREATAIDTGNALLSRAADLGADSIVMGAYGHTRLREWVLGGMTKHLLEHMTVPTLMTH
jgi:nucleotide-binding universal stress UspA family protein